MIEPFRTGWARVDALRQRLGFEARSRCDMADAVVARRGFGSLPGRLARRFGEPVEITLGSGLESPDAVLWEAGTAASRFRFHDGLFDHPHGRVLVERWHACLPMLSEARADVRRPVGATALELGDYGTGQGLTFCDFRADARLVPDPQFLASDGYRERKAAFAADPVPWDAREPRALWRGQTSGWHDMRGKPVSSWRDLPRVQLCRLATSPEGRAVLDAGITGFAQVGDPQAERAMVAEGLAAPRLDWRRFSSWRYQIDIDGNSNAWEGLFVKLCTGSPVLKVASPLGFRQWYYDGLIPWRTFVPVAADPSDLVDKVTWLRAHDTEARAIGQAARALADSMSLGRETRRARPVIRSALQAGA